MQIRCFFNTYTEQLPFEIYARPPYSLTIGLQKKGGAPLKMRATFHTFFVSVHTSYIIGKKRKN
jgi:hypothetical protein